MQQKLLNRIRLVENCIENSLSNEDFVSIPALSLDLEKLVKEDAASIKLDENFKSNSEELEKLSHKLAFFKEQTVNKFRNYQSKVSAQTKMHQAYKKFSG